jgi:UDP-N-acetylglucosamine--N-acetylmuramyl-(pentapeptide) pyrophosphoryl-undecaprenol N-acetylglucosamine transferase
MKGKILIAAGGSGGHLIPAQQLAELLEKKHQCQVLFAGYKLSSSPFFQQKRFSFREIPSAPISFAFFKAFWKGFWKSVWMLWKEKPHVVVGFGSYHTVPVLLAAVLFRKKIILYEANRVMGKVNWLISLFAEKVAGQFPPVGNPSKKWVSIPLFPWIPQTAHRLTKEAARREFGLDPARTTLLVFGGSQGAAFLNEKIPHAIKDLASIQVIHLTGSETSAREVRKQYSEWGIPAAVKAYEHQMQHAYDAADLAICRSGAGTTAELIRYQIPSILIPFPHAADDHQRHNAEYLQGLGCAVLLPQKKATAKAITERIANADIHGMKLSLQLCSEPNEPRVDFDTLITRMLP